MNSGINNSDIPMTLIRLLILFVLSNLLIKKITHSIFTASCCICHHYATACSLCVGYATLFADCADYADYADKRYLIFSYLVL